MGALYFGHVCCRVDSSSPWCPLAWWELGEAYELMAQLGELAPGRETIHVSLDWLTDIFGDEVPRFAFEGSVLASFRTTVTGAVFEAIVASTESLLKWGLQVQVVFTGDQ
jgi:hypothetical protein